VTLRQAGTSVSATLPKDMADRLRLEPEDRVPALAVAGFTFTDLGRNLHDNRHDRRVHGRRGEG
jgi:hypothetical protein